MIYPMTIAALHDAYRTAAVTPEQLLKDCWLAAQNDTHNAWISVLAEPQLQHYIDNLAGHSPADLPLYGIPFAIKDNIDLADLPTTAACPDYAYQPQQHAFVVEQLIAAGAVPIGKTNLDQFATGLVGTRSPYGACHNSFDERYISGGSSAGSAVAVACGQVVFALGTDTAGSGRVPAAFNNILGLKGSVGAVSCQGVVPACKSLDCVTLFAKTAADLEQVWAIAATFDAEDPFARPLPPQQTAPGRFTFGIPRADALQFFGDEHAERLFAGAIAQLEAMGGQAVEIDMTPLLEAAKLLYEGPWVAERLAAIRDFYEHHAASCLPMIQTIIGGAQQYSAADAYQALYQLQTLKRQADTCVQSVDVMLTPTAPTIYTIAELEGEPIKLNSQLGLYTNFMNLLDYTAIALPAGCRPHGPKASLPFGITLFSQVFSEQKLLQLAARWQQYCPQPLGALPAQRQYIDLAVCGAHLQGMVLNYQLSDKGAKLIESTTTAATYRLYALAERAPQRPALVRAEQGSPIEVEVWRLPAQHLADFLAGIGAPLGLGKVELADGRWVSGFNCEPCAIKGATDITHLGSWRNYKAQ